MQRSDRVPEKHKPNIPKTQAERYKLQSSLQHRPIKVRRKELAAIIGSFTDEEKLNCVLDLRAFMQLHPWTIPADAPLSHAYRIFRTMGLRQLYVTQTKPTVIGILTRKDMTEEAACLRLGEVIKQHEHRGVSI